MAKKCEKFVETVYPTTCRLSINFCNKTKQTQKKKILCNCCKCQRKARNVWASENLNDLLLLPIIQLSFFFECDYNEQALKIHLRQQTPIHTKNILNISTQRPLTYTLGQQQNTFCLKQVVAFRQTSVVFHLQLQKKI